MEKLRIAIETETPLCTHPEYSKKWNAFYDDLKENGNIDDCEKILSILKKQRERAEKSDLPSEAKDIVLMMLDEEIENVYDLWNGYNKQLIEPRTLKINLGVSFNMNVGPNQPSAILQPEPITLSIPLPPQKPFRALSQAIKGIGEKVMHKLKVQFGKKETICTLEDGKPCRGVFLDSITLESETKMYVTAPSKKIQVQPLRITPPAKQERETHESVQKSPTLEQAVKGQKDLTPPMAAPAPPEPPKPPKPKAHKKASHTIDLD